MDQDGDVIDILVQRYRNARAAKRFFRKLLKGQVSKPWQLVTDRLKSYGAAHRSLMPGVDHNTERYAHNRAEVSHRPTRQRKRQMRGFKSAGQAQRFSSVHGVIQNLFNLGRHHLRSENYRLSREGSATTVAARPSHPGVGDSASSPYPFLRSGHSAWDVDLGRSEGAEDGLHPGRWAQ